MYRLDEIKSSVVSGRMEETVAGIHAAISSGIPPGDIILMGLIDAMTVVG